jgi:hypothetical protein
MLRWSRTRRIGQQIGQQVHLLVQVVDTPVKMFQRSGHRLFAGAVRNQPIHRRPRKL